ncbi:MAG TPA: phosphatidate cytidylyltransferase [Verrucomicrobiae bacterium]|nr:phosphatidate cytidylyltransferase [Verrucomicrobiae bacterium]
MLARILTAAVLIPLVVALVWWGPPALLAAIAAGVAMLAMWEFFALGDRMGMPAFRYWTLICAAAIFYAQYCAGLVETHSIAGGFSLVRQAASGTLSLEAALLIFVFGTAAAGIGTRRALHDVLPAIGAGSAGLLFVALPFSYLVRLNAIDRYGRQLVLFTLSLMWAGDTFAYFAGKTFGRVPFAPALSPKKTWEGAFANMVGSLLVAIAFARWMQTEATTMLMIAALANVAGQLGDLIKSAYKRGASVKDSGSLLPGHGGVLDRIDSLILASPVVWAAWQWFAGR